ncbi:MAG: LacI family DNA-binding transcriptional regulator [Arachnia sp.]
MVAGADGVSRRKVGIRDVAAAAGVSVTTVSHVLNETPHTRTSVATSARVRQVAQELGYKTNRFAQGLRTQASGMIGLVTEEIATTPYAGKIIQGAQDAAAARGLTLAILNSELTHEPMVDARLVRALVDRHVDGMIYATVYHDIVAAPPEMHEAPAVLIGASDESGQIPSVMPAERAGAASVVRMLHEAGHTRIAFLGSSNDVPATRGRLTGYRDAMAQLGLPSDGLELQAESEAAGGYAAARALLEPDRPDPRRPTAVFCYNDRMAMGAYRGAAELGLTVPTDVSIVGFDDQDPIGYSLYPGLTTVALPHYELGSWAVETLATPLASDAAPVGPTLLDCPLVYRGSVASPSH